MLVRICACLLWCSLEIDAISIPPDDNLYPSLSHLTNLQVCKCVGTCVGTLFPVSASSRAQCQNVVVTHLH